MLLVLQHRLFSASNIYKRIFSRIFHSSSQSNSRRYMTKTQKNSRSCMTFAARTIVSCKYYSFLLYSSYKMAANWNDKNIQHHVPHQHLMLRTAPEASPFSLVTTSLITSLGNTTFPFLLTDFPAAVWTKFCFLRHFANIDEIAQIVCLCFNRLNLFNFIEITFFADQWIQKSHAETSLSIVQ